MPGQSPFSLIPALIREFPRWVDYFNDRSPFSKPEQLACHRATIELRRRHGTVADAVADSDFVRSLHDTLRAWGIGSRRSKLRSLPEFSDALRAAIPQVASVENLDVGSGDLDVDKTASDVWVVIASLGIVANQAPLVAGTKALHHLLPELVPPMDREYTQRFFGWANPIFQYRQRECFTQAFGAFVLVAREVAPAQYVGLRPWNTSQTKVLDNALVGLLRAVLDGMTA